MAIFILYVDEEMKQIPLERYYDYNIMTSGLTSGKQLGWDM